MDNETKMAASWLFHSEEPEEVWKQFPNANRVHAQQLADSFHALSMDYDRVHMWAMEN